jgi:hypothetical protein
VFNKTLVPVSAGGKPNEHDDRYAYSQLAMPLSRFIGVLNGPYFRTQKITFIDKTGVAANVDIKFNCDMTNLAEINEALKKYGLVFKIEPTPVDILIFSATSH